MTILELSITFFLTLFSVFLLINIFVTLQMRRNYMTHLNTIIEIRRGEVSKSLEFLEDFRKELQDFFDTQLDMKADLAGLEDEAADMRNQLSDIEDNLNHLSVNGQISLGDLYEMIQDLSPEPFDKNPTKNHFPVKRSYKRRKPKEIEHKDED